MVSVSLCIKVLLAAGRQSRTANTSRWSTERSTIFSSSAPRQTNVRFSSGARLKRRTAGVRNRDNQESGPARFPEHSGSPFRHASGERRVDFSPLPLGVRGWGSPTRHNSLR
jgi:hypothetical protein